MRLLSKPYFFSVIVLFCCLSFFVFEDEIDNKVKDYKTQNSVAKYNTMLETPFERALIDYYMPTLNKHSRKRDEAFAKIIALAEVQSSQTKKPIIIVETGSMRSPYLRFGGDGSSTLIFNHFVDKDRGKVYTVDINPRCKEIVDNIYQLKNTRSYTMDSIEFLKNFESPQDITVLYLDSYDVDFKNPMRSAKHHLKEIEVIFNRLISGTIIAVDDNVILNKIPSGKGYLVEEFLKDKATLVYDGYIKVFQVK